MSSIPPAIFPVGPPPIAPPGFTGFAQAPTVTSAVIPSAPQSYASVPSGLSDSLVGAGAGTKVVVMILAFLILVGLVIFFMHLISESKVQPWTRDRRVVAPTFTDPIGASTTGTVNFDNGDALKDESSCNTVATRNWLNSHCRCNPPYFGPACQREANDSNFAYAAGNPAAGNVSYGFVTLGVANQLAFKLDPSQTTCQELCEGTDGCTAFLWEAPPFRERGIPTSMGSCSVITGSVVVNSGSNIPYNVETQSTLYMRNGQFPIFTDRLFLFRGTLPLRYWVGHTASSTPVFAGKQVHLSFFPESWVNDSPLAVVLAEHSIEMSKLPEIIAVGTNATYFVVYPGTVFALPGTRRVHFAAAGATP